MIRGSFSSALRVLIAWATLFACTPVVRSATPIPATTAAPHSGEREPRSGSQAQTSLAPAPLPTATATQLYLPLVGKGLPLNLLRNGQFEAGNLQGWEANGATASRDNAHTGGWSARLANTRLRAMLSTVPGRTYKALAWIKLVSENGSDWGGFTLTAFDRNWNPLSQTGPYLRATHGSDWFKVALTFTADSATTPFDIGYFGGPGRQLVAHVDDVYVFTREDPNQPPVVTPALTPATFNSLPQTQTFTLAGDDFDGAITRVQWEFGDGGRALEANGSRHVTLPGTYTATVTIADDEGATATHTLPWQVEAPGFPTLAITSPDEASESDAPVLTVQGVASDSALKIIVSSDRGGYAEVAGAENWEAAVTLQPGFNRVLVQAHDDVGHIITQSRMVRYVPPGLLALGTIQAAETVEKWEPLIIAFELQNSAATHPHFPYEAAPPLGLAMVDGVTVDALFTPDDWRTVYRRPAFLYQPYQRALKDGAEWLRPDGNPVWTVLFSPSATGEWKYRLEAVEAKGSAQSVEGVFTVIASTNPLNRGPVRVALNDTRYFEFADGTPFLGAGHNLGFSTERFSFEATEAFDRIGVGNQDFFRWWVSGRLWGSAWQPWRSRTLPGNGYLPATGLTVERGYAGGLAALKLDAANPILFQGFDSGRATLIPGHRYRLTARWRTEGVIGPAVAGQPYGLTLKLMGWPEPGQTGSAPALLTHVAGDTPWHVASAEFTATGDFIENVVLVLENATGGAAFVDEVTLTELIDGQPGPQLLRGPQANSHLEFDSARAFGMDVIVEEAQRRGAYFKLVICEKNEYLLNHLAPDGLPERLGDQFNGGLGTPARWLHEAYWRYLFARYGAYRSVHSWELVNEAAPGPGSHFRLTADLAQRAGADGNPHPASTSTWATLAEAAWKHPDSAPISYADFHAYVRGTGFIEPEAELANDSARFFNEYDLAARAANFGKPVVWGELGIDTGNTNEPDPLLVRDTDGVWLHKLTWARTGPGGVYPLYWYTDQIFAQSLHRIFGAWTRFMLGIPLTNGRYEDVRAEVSTGNLRVLGQKDVQAGRAHVWIDNRAHTWWAVVDGRAIPPVSGAVRIALQHPNASYRVTWHNTRTGEPVSVQTLTADSSGVLTLSLSNLTTDTAAQIERTAP
ncbi:MAG: PKD domain-containing protein [Anaerolineales bacterium]